MLLPLHSAWDARGFINDKRTEACFLLFFTSYQPRENCSDTGPRVGHEGRREQWQQIMIQPESRKEVNKASQIPRPQSVLAERDPRGQLVFFPLYVCVGKAEDVGINIFQKEGRKKEYLRPIPFTSILVYHFWHGLL